LGSLKEVGAPSSDPAYTDGGFFTSKVDALVNWGRTNSLWPMPLGLSCCGIELMAMLGPKFDLARFGAEAARFSPRQCDLLVVAGTLTWKMAEACRTIYDQMPDPKWVIAMGVCSSSGGMYDSYAVVQGVDMLLPVDVYVPGCPPRPDAVIDAILKLQKKIKRESPMRGILAEPPAEVWEEGTGTFLRAPNHEIPTRRAHVHVPAEGPRRAVWDEEADELRPGPNIDVPIRDTGVQQPPAATPPVQRKDPKEPEAGS
jgi:NADH-quinone oxidoreductase subunit B